MTLLITQALIIIMTLNPFTHQSEKPKSKYTFYETETHIVLDILIPAKDVAYASKIIRQEKENNENLQFSITHLRDGNVAIRVKQKKHLLRRKQMLVSIVP